MSTGDDIIAAVGAAGELAEIGLEIFKHARAEAAAPDEAAAAEAREKRKHALEQLARETQRQLLEFEIDKA